MCMLVHTQYRISDSDEANRKQHGYVTSPRIPLRDRHVPQPSPALHPCPRPRTRSRGCVLAYPRAKAYSASSRASVMVKRTEHIKRLKAGTSCIHAYARRYSYSPAHWTRSRSCIPACPRRRTSARCSSILWTKCKREHETKTRKKARRPLQPPHTPTAMPVKPHPCARLQPLRPAHGHVVVSRRVHEGGKAHAVRGALAQAAQGGHGVAARQQERAVGVGAPGRGGEGGRA